MMRKVFFAPALLAMAAASLLLTGAATPMSEPGIGTPAPAFTLEDASGKPVSLSDYKGKIVVLEWANRECPIYKRVAESKFITGVASKYKDKGVEFIAIDSTAKHGSEDY